MRTPSATPPGPANGWLGWCHVRRLQADVLQYALELGRRYGDCVAFRIGPIKNFLLYHPRHVEQLLVKQATALAKLPAVKWYFGRWMGRGLLLNEGTAWQSQRRKVRAAMQQIDPESHAATVVRYTLRMLANYCKLGTDLAAAFDRLAFALNVHLLLGDEADSVLEGLHQAACELHAIGIRELARWSLIPDWLPLQSKARLRAARRHYDEVLLSAAQRRAASPQADLLSLLLHASDRHTPGHGMSVRQARDEAANLLMGGKETVSASLTFSCWLLAQHPHVQEEARREVQQTLADRPPHASDVAKLALTQMVIKEAMRLYPPVYIIARQLQRPLWIDGYRLPRFSQVMLPVYAIHRDARWFDAPEEFNPRRFEPEAERRRQPYAYLPFGAGPRRCVGAALGYQQCVLALATLLQSYRLRLPSTPITLRLAADIALHPKDPLPLVIDPLDGHGPATAPACHTHGGMAAT
ncbi:MAG: cytochrome P450 [Pirellulales bacterium]|nr:cytochrome P450 [Pirellulales bacterium]